MSKQVANLENKIQKLKENLLEKDARIDKLENQVEKLTQMLLDAQNARFGPSSEKSSYILNSDLNQLSFFDEAENIQDPKSVEPTEETFLNVKLEETQEDNQEEPKKRKKRRSIEEKYADLPVKEIILSLPEEQSFCTTCGGALKMIGKKFIRQEMIMVPRSFYLIIPCIQTKKSCKIVRKML